jgi:hypothetical protein
MSEREQLIKELEQSPDFLVHEVLNFLLFIKARTAEISQQESLEKTQESNTPEFLSFIDQINSETPKTKKLRPFGLCAGEFVVPEDFDAPLQEEILNAFEGK